MVIRKKQAFDVFMYLCLIIFLVFDLINSIFKSNSIVVVVSFIPILLLTIYLFFRTDGFLTIDQMLAVYVFVFCYFTPLHQYVDHVNIHNFSSITESDYLVANSIIIFFLIIYLYGRNVKNKKLFHLKYKSNIFVNSTSLFWLTVLSVSCLIWLQRNNVLFNFNNLANNAPDDSLGVIILKVIRFIPISSLLLIIFTLKNKKRSRFDTADYVMLIIIIFVCLIIYFPLNGTINRYLLFGTYLMLGHALFPNCKHKSIIIIAAFLGFYYIFPAFNFFKYHSIMDLKQFALEGFDSSFIDFDAYEMLVQGIHYVSKEGVLWGKNILSALLCFIPRSIWKGKEIASGQLISEYYRASFTNLSFPIYAEFYLAFGIFGVCIFSYFLSKLINAIEEDDKNSNILNKVIECIMVGMIIPLSRGALLPMTSFFLSLLLSLAICCMVCNLCVKKRKSYENSV